MQHSLDLKLNLNLKLSLDLKDEMRMICNGGGGHHLQNWFPVMHAPAENHPWMQKGSHGCCCCCCYDCYKQDCDCDAAVTFFGSCSVHSNHSYRIIPRRRRGVAVLLLPHRCCCTPDYDVALAAVAIFKM